MTGFLRLIALMVFPYLTTHFQTEGEDLPKDYNGLKNKIVHLANRVKYRGGRIMTFDCKETDLHANASALSL